MPIDIPSELSLIDATFHIFGLDAAPDTFTTNLSFLCGIDAAILYGNN